MVNYEQEKLIIDLSGAVSISDLGIKITGMLDAGSAANKELHLKLGSLDLKQSQLLSIKALVEAMQAKIVSIETTSELTETSAIGLGLVVGRVAEKPLESPVTTSYTPTQQAEPVNSDELSSFAQLKKMNSLGDSVTDAGSLDEVKSENVEEETKEFLKEAAASDYENHIQESNIYDSIESDLPKNDIQNALDITFGTRFDSEEEKTSDNLFDTQNAFQEKFESHEITETTKKDEEGKYVLLDTEGITPEGVELIKSNTSDLETLYLTQTLRSGQTVSFEGNIFLIGDAHPGSEINATGDITVWGILGGIVHAGSKGNTSAKVRALKLNPIQLRIANLYSRRNDTVNVPYVQKSNEFTPEEARIENEQIVIYKTLRRED